MRKKKIDSVQNSKPEAWLNVVLSSSLAVLFSFFFVFAQASQFERVKIEDRGLSEHSFELAKTHLSAEPGHPINLPFGAFPIPSEPESKTERESDDQSHDDADKLATFLSLKERLTTTSGRCRLLHLLISRENRKEVSLVILHHSWKSFLS